MELSLCSRHYKETHFHSNMFLGSRIYSYIAVSFEVVMWRNKRKSIIKFGRLYRSNIFNMKTPERWSTLPRHALLFTIPQTYIPKRCTLIQVLPLHKEAGQICQTVQLWETGTYTHIQMDRTLYPPLLTSEGNMCCCMNHNILMNTWWWLLDLRTARSTFMMKNHL